MSASIKSVKQPAASLRVESGYSDNSKRKATRPPVSRLCNSDAVEDVLYNCVIVLEFVRKIDLSQAADSERDDASFGYGRSIVLRSVVEALEYASELHNHEVKEAAHG